MILALIVLFPIGGFSEILTIVLVSTVAVTGLALLWTRWLPYKNSKVRVRTAIISAALAIAGVVPMFFIDNSGPIISFPPFLISYVAGGALFSLLTTPKVSSKGGADSTRQNNK